MSSLQVAVIVACLVVSFVGAIWFAFLFRQHAKIDSVWVVCQMFRMKQPSPQPQFPTLADMESTTSQRTSADTGF